MASRRSPRRDIIVDACHSIVIVVIRCLVRVCQYHLRDATV